MVLASKVREVVNMPFSNSIKPLIIGLHSSGGVEI
jgi:hypothetical protein